MNNIDLDNLVASMATDVAQEELEIQKKFQTSCGGINVPECMGGGGGPLRIIAFDEM